MHQGYCANPKCPVVYVERTGIDQCPNCGNPLAETDAEIRKEGAAIVTKVKVSAGGW